MNIQHGSNRKMNRRGFLVAVSATALLLVTACATFRRESEVDAAFADLEALLNSAGGSDPDEIAAIAERMKTATRALLDTHKTFMKEFNEQAADRNVTPDDLDALLDDYLVSRKTQRDALLHMQDELHAAIPADAWPEIQRVLNRKSQAIAGGTV